MTPMDRVAVPPALATWLVELFASPQEADAVAGDLREEFGALAASDGEARARAWYWRHSLRTIGHLATGPFRRRPWAMLGIGVLGLAATWPVGWATNQAAQRLVLSYPVYDYVSAAAFWPLSQAVSFFIVGLMVSWVARTRPVAVALAIVAVMLLLLCVIDPVVVTLLDARPSRSLSFWAVRALVGLANFGLPVMLGAMLGRKVRPRLLAA